MMLQKGDFFEGVYQLREELASGDRQQAARWLADDFSGSQKKLVVIDLFPYDPDPRLHWETDSKGLSRIGQSAAYAVRYFVWEKGEERILTPLSHDKVSEQEKRKFVHMIENMDLAPDEMILLNDIPEYWRTSREEILFFYRKQTSPFADEKQNAEIRHFWKKSLVPDYTPPRPEPASMPVRKVIEKESHLAVPDTVWKLCLIAIGILLAVGVYALKASRSTRGSDTSHLIAFNQALQAGVDQERQGNYEQALLLFDKAASFPLSDQTQNSLDSLAHVYETYAQKECEKYRALGSSNLFFIADQYFHYASVLTGEKNARKCE
jgi:hypothetical protein